MNKRLIKLTGDKIYYTKTDFLRLTSTNLPANSLLFKPYAELFWEVELTHFDRQQQALSIKVLKYAIKEIAAFEEQTAKAPLLHIYFDKLDWKRLEPLLSYYAETELEPFLFNKKKLREEGIFFKAVDAAMLLATPEELDEIGRLEEEKDVDDYDYLEEEEIEAPEPIKKREPVLRQETAEFWFPFRKASFQFGHVLVKKKLSFLYNSLEICIYNSEILPEYEYIKGYFPKALKCKAEFLVKVKVHFSDSRIIKVEAQSLEIAAINERVIGVVRQLRTLSLPKLLQPEVDQSLFTADQVFDPLKDEGPDANIFAQDPDDILATLLEGLDVRNAKQLAYLAERQSTKQQLRFTLKPNFGFLFCIEGEAYRHFCWELLNSHATYLWSFDKDAPTQQQLNVVEININLIREGNRLRYKKAYIQGELSEELIFNVIQHKGVNSTFIDGFVLWKQRFKERIV